MIFSPELILTQLLNGLMTGTVLVLIASGLTLVFGMMEVINFAHGSLYMLGAYFGYTLVAWTGNFWLALVLAPLGVAGVGWVIEFFGIRPLQGRHHLYHLLVTYGLSLIFWQGTEIIWGSGLLRVHAPPEVSGILRVGKFVYPEYRLFVLGFSATVVALIWLYLRRSRWGLVVRAAVHDPEMVAALGTNVKRAFTLVFVVGSALAALAGVVVSPLHSSIRPDMGMDVIIEAFIVVIIGGLGSFQGAVVGGLILGLAKTLGFIFVPRLTEAVIFLVVAVVLIIRPAGLLGEAE